MNADRQMPVAARSPRPRRAPGAVLVARALDALLAASAAGTVLWVVTLEPEANQGLGLYFLVLFGVLVTAFAALALSLRRLCAWAWVVQLVWLCLVIGMMPVPAIVIVPLLVAWCGGSVRDWFDPPLCREF